MLRHGGRAVNVSRDILALSPHCRIALSAGDGASVHSTVRESWPLAKLLSLFGVFKGNNIHLGLVSVVSSSVLSINQRLLLFLPLLHSVLLSSSFLSISFLTLLTTLSLSLSLRSLTLCATMLHRETVFQCSKNIAPSFFFFRPFSPLGEKLTWAFFLLSIPSQ